MQIFTSPASHTLTRKAALIGIPVLLCLQLFHVAHVGRTAVEPPASVLTTLEPCEEFGSIKDNVMQTFPYQAVGSFLNTATFGVSGWGWSLFDGSSNIGHVKTYAGTPLCIMSDLEWLPLTAGRLSGVVSGLLLWWVYLGYCIFKRKERISRWLLALLSAVVVSPVLIAAVLMAYLAR